MISTLKSLFGIVFLSVFFSVVSSAQIISTIAGNGTPGNSGDGGQALSASVQGNDIAADGAGNVYFVTDLTIRKVSSAGIITLLAGNGTSGTGGDGGLAINAQFLIPRGIGADAAGNVYICDGNRVRKISTAGIITTIAGSTTAGNTGDGGQATAALLNAPADVATDGSNNVYITDRGNNRVRKITAITGVIAAHFSMNNCGFIAVTTNGAVYYTNYFNSIDRFYNGVNTPLSTGYSSYPYGPDGVLAYTNGYSAVQGLAVDDAGNIFLTANNKVRIIRPNNYIYTYAGNGTAAFGGDGGAAYLANLNDPKGVAVQGSTLYISDKGNYRIRKVNGCTGEPSIPGAISGTTIFCPGTSYTFSVPVSTEGFYYRWLFPNGWTITSSSFLNTVTVTAGSAPGAVSVCTFNTCDTSAYQTLGLTSVLPGPIFSSPALQGLCPGGSIPLSVTTAPNMSVQWNKDGVTIPGATSVNYSANATGWYTVTQTHTSGCTGQFSGCGLTAASADIYDGFPSQQSICQGDSMHLFSQTNLVNPTAYQWKKDGVDIPGATNYDFYATQLGDYTVSITAACNILSSVHDLTVVDTPDISLYQSAEAFCPGAGAINLNLTTSAPYIGWFQGTNQIDYNGSYQANNPGLYIGVAENFSGCTSSVYVNLVNHPMSVGVFTQGGSNLVCDGSDLLLIADSLTNYNIQWSFNGSIVPGATNASYTATTTGTYTYTVSDDVCGPYTGGTSVYIYSLDDTVAADGPLEICEGENVELSIPYVSGNYYQWMFNGSPLSGATNNFYLTTIAGNYSVEVNNIFCWDTTDIVYVTVNPNPTPTITQSGNDLSVPSGFISYQWYFNGTAISGANSETYTATQDGDYYVIVSDGCEGQSNTVNLFLAVGDVNTLKNTIVIRPNPFTDFATLSFSNVQHAPHSFKLYNVQGQLVQEVGNITSGELRIERGILPAGIYYYQLYKENSIVGNGKLVIQ